MRCALLEAELRGTAAAKADAQATPHDTWHTSQRDACDLYFIPFFTLWIQARLLDSEAAAADALARAQTLLQQLDEVRPAPAPVHPRRSGCHRPSRGPALPQCGGRIA